MSNALLGFFKEISEDFLKKSFKKPWRKSFEGAISFQGSKLHFHVGGVEAVVEEVWRMRNDWVSEVPSSHEDLHQTLSEPSSSLAYHRYHRHIRGIIGIRGIRSSLKS